jgi:hypothetical protein
MLREEHRLRVFEKSVLRRKFRPMRGKIRGDCRKLHNEELHNLYVSPNIISMIKSRNMRWIGHVARMRQKAVHAEFWSENVCERTTRKV